MRRHTRASLVSLVTLVTLTGCADQHDIGQLPGAAGVQEIVPVIGSSLASGDGPRACSLMSMKAQERLAIAMRARNCLASVAIASAALGSSEREWLGAVTLRDVRVTGVTASGKLEGKSSMPPAVRDLFGGEVVIFRNEFERWELDDQP